MGVTVGLGLEQSVGVEIDVGSVGRKVADLGKRGVDALVGIL